MRYLAGGATLTLDDARCTGCGRCVEVCPHAVFALVEGKARIVAREYCMECGACARNCEGESLAVRTGVGCATALLRSRSTGGPACCC